MTEDTSNLVLEHLRAIRATQGEHSRRFDELGRRITNVEDALRAVRRDLLVHDEDTATLRQEVEGLRSQVDRINARLGLVD
ncbi:hypothetical protein [Methyloraptor flagellatus]|uniref:DUF4164 family protein n=1 Tax=Methyloraptor flagellatus TaxID=3162530 RepID=A0AAU7XCG1_9HYPH